MTDLGFDGKVAIVTGAGGGLGKQHALLLASRGARVVVNDLGGIVSPARARDTGPAEAVVDEIRGLGGEAVSDTNSVSTPEGGRGHRPDRDRRLRPVDIVVNNAGILRDKTFHNMTPDLLEPGHRRPPERRVLRHPAGLDRGCASRATVGSSTRRPTRGSSATSARPTTARRRWALVGLTRVLAAEGAKYNIKVNAIAPLARTRMTEERHGRSRRRRSIPSWCLRSWPGSVHEDVPVTGEVYTVGGGRVARFFIGMTTGYYNPKLCTVEDVRDHFDEIRDESGYTVPAGPA